MMFQYSAAECDSRTGSGRSGAPDQLRRVLGLAACLILIFCLSGLADNTDGEESSDSTHTSVTTIDWDSVYAIVQSDYESVRPLFERGCFDCHSDRTRYPWYHRLPLVRSFLDDHIRDARKHLDMTDGFPFKGHKRPADDLFNIREEIDGGEMPLWSYRIMHWGTAPNDAEQDSIFQWIDRTLRLMAAHGQYPLGDPSLVPSTEETQSDESVP